MLSERKTNFEFCSSRMENGANFLGGVGLARQTFPDPAPKTHITAFSIQNPISAIQGRYGREDTIGVLFVLSTWIFSNPRLLQSTPQTLKRVAPPPTPYLYILPVHTPWQRSFGRFRDLA